MCNKNNLVEFYFIVFIVRERKLSTEGSTRRGSQLVLVIGFPVVDYCGSSLPMFWFHVTSPRLPFAWMWSDKTEVKIHRK